MDILKFTAIVVTVVSTVFAQEKIISECPSVFEFVNRTGDQWFGKLHLSATSFMEGAQIEIVFDEAVGAFVNNFGLSRATDNRTFTIESQKDLEAGDKIDLFFFLTFANPLIVPRISTVHFNGNRVCPDNISIGNRNCIGFDTTSTTKGRWDGVLSVYPKFAQTGLKITIELDGEAFVLGNDFGESRTLDSKKFIITSRRTVKKEERIKIKFFVKYSELEQIPDLISISIDDQVYCVKNSSTVMAPIINSPPIAVPIKPNGLDISLSELPISRYPAIEQIPTEVDNKDFACGSSMLTSNRIQNGLLSERGQFPFHAAVYINSLYKCGGSLISEKVVITAAHCIVGVGTTVREKEAFTIVLGLIDLRNLTGVEAIRKVTEVIKHTDYGIINSIPQNDIGILVLNGKIQYSSFIAPICLFDSLTLIDEHFGKKGLVLGWGLKTDNEISQYLNYGRMTFLTRSECSHSSLLFGLLPTSAFCASSNGTMQTVCSGDSGGGMILLEDGKFYLRGLVSVSITDAGQSCDVKYSIAFTDVSYFLKWIWDEMKIVTDFDERIALSQNVQLN